MPSWHIRSLFALFAAVLLAGSAPAAAEYPERPIKLVIPFPPGGETDPLARRITGALAKNLGQPIVIENRESAMWGEVIHKAGITAE